MMGLLDTLADILNKDDSEQGIKLNQFIEDLSPDILSRSLAETFRSDQTPEIGNMVGQLFNQSSNQQQAGLLNAVINYLGPAAAAALAGGVLNTVIDARENQVTPEQAAQLTPQQVEDVVNQAQATHSGIVDQVADFYAQHRSLVNTLGGIAASVALMKIKDQLSEKK